MIKVRMAVSGGAGSFSEQAALLYAQQKNQELETVFADTMEGVLQKVEKLEVPFGLFAFHNSQSGFVQDALVAMKHHGYDVESFLAAVSFDDVLNPLKKNSRIVDFFRMEIAPCLLVLTDVKREEVTQVASYVQALLQCREYLQQYFPQMKLLETPDTAKAAENLAKGKLPRCTAVIASARAAERYGLKILERGIENKKDGRPNVTTFLIVKK